MMYIYWVELAGKYVTYDKSDNIRKVNIFNVYVNKKIPIEEVTSISTSEGKVIQIKKTDGAIVDACGAINVGTPHIKVDLNEIITIKYTERLKYINDTVITERDIYLNEDTPLIKNIDKNAFISKGFLNEYLHTLEDEFQSKPKSAEALGVANQRLLWFIETITKETPTYNICLKWSESLTRVFDIYADDDAIFKLRNIL